MSEYLSKKAVLEWLKKRLDETQFVREAHALAEVVAKIECGRFDDDQTEALASTPTEPSGAEGDGNDA